jgi:hypothetical protein
MRRILPMLLLLLAVSSVSQAQTPAEKPKVETPMVSVEDGLKLANYMLQAENLALKIQTLQTEQEKLSKVFNEMLQSMQKPGFHLERDAKSQNFVYVADPPKKEPEKK